MLVVGVMRPGPLDLSGRDNRIWDPDSGEQTAELTGHTGTVLPT